MSTRIRYIIQNFPQRDYNRLMKTLENSFKLANADVVSFRLKVLDHGKIYGSNSACHAFGLSRATYFRWQKRFVESKKRLSSLVPCKTTPKRVRVMRTDYRLLEFITSFRKQFGNLGRAKIKIFLDEYAKQLEIKSLSERTIGKIIQRKHLFENKRKHYQKSKSKRLRSKYAPKVKSPGFIEVDCVTLYLAGEKHYFVCCIDVFTKFALVKKVKTLSSLNAKTVFADFQKLLSFPIQTVQTDNGSEFLHTFSAYLEKQNITHFFSYPHCPRTNGVVERFNRTLQEEFLERSQTLINNSDQFCGKLELWLSWYNTKRPHAALKYQSPQQFLTNL